MTDSSILPRAGSQIVDARGMATREFDRVLSQLLGQSTTNIADLVSRIQALEQDESGGFVVQGFGSISVSGSVESGVIQLTLRGDADSPGPAFVYSTNAAGEKGWRLLRDCTEAGVGLVQTDSGYLVVDRVATPDDLPLSGNSGEAVIVLDVDPGIYAWDGMAFTLDSAADRIVGFQLATLANSGTGTALVKLTRDDYGRVEGTEAATAADLPYDNGTSGLTADDVQEAIDELAASSGGFVPYFIASATTFTVPEYKQALFHMLIDNEGSLVVDGYLLEV